MNELDSRPDRGRARRARTPALCVLAGACLCLSVPPWGWWPLAFVGAALWDRLLTDAPRAARFRRSWLLTVAWLGPAMVWMWDLTAPGFVVATTVYAAYVGAAAMAVPPGPGRRLALPAALVVAEWARWTFPFGGVPLANLALGQAGAPLGQTARLVTALGVCGLVVVGGVALSAAAQRQWRPAAVASSIVVVSIGFSAVAPRGEATGAFEAAIVQGGGPQRTRAADTDERVVFERHLDASELVTPPIDLVLWPENVVSVEGALADSREERELEALSARLGAPVVVGVTEGISDTAFLNASVVIGADGQGDRYDKVLRVPFGEFVPLRSLVERLAPDAGLPGRDAVAGDGPAVIDVALADGSPVRMGVIISWEVFFSARGRDATRNGGEVILNPTNGSSYWLTQVQTQQVASSRLRAIESGRWVLQAAPTGLSAVVTERGEVLERSDVSETRVLRHTVERRRGLTIASRVGQWAALVVATGALAAAWRVDRRHRGPIVDRPGAGSHLE